MTDHFYLAVIPEKSSLHFTNNANHFTKIKMKCSFKLRPTLIIGSKMQTQNSKTNLFSLVLKLLLVLTLAYLMRKTCIFTCTANLLIRLAFFNNQPDVVTFKICITSAIAHKTLVDTTPLTKLKMMSDNVSSHQKHF